MATSTKTQRKIKTANRRRVNAEDRVRQAMNMNINLAQQAISENRKVVHLSKLLAFVVAKFGDKGTLRLSVKQIDQIPEGARMQEAFDEEADELILMTVLPDDAPDPQIEVITPKIEVVSR